MSFATKGYLSRTAGHIIREAREAHPEWFKLLYEINELAHTLPDEVAKAKPIFEGTARADPRLLICLLFSRALSNFQGAVLMIERGMIIESRLQARSLLETKFYAQGLDEQGDELVRKLYDTAHAKQGHLINLLLNVKDLHIQFPQHRREDLQTQRRKIDAMDLREKVNVETISRHPWHATEYVHYSAMSADATHPGVAALARFLRRQSGERDVSIIVTPAIHVPEVVATLSLMSSAMIDMMRLYICAIYGPNGGYHVQRIITDLHTRRQMLNADENHKEPSTPPPTMPPKRLTANQKQNVERKAVRAQQRAMRRASMGR